MAVVSDIKSYAVFANIDDRKGTVSGHMVILTPEQYEMIEAIVLNAISVKVSEEKTYTVEV